jgi:predicted transcriptional regulator
MTPDPGNEFWDEIYATIPAEIQPGEKTISMMAKELHRDPQTIKSWVASQVAAGRLVSVGLRRCKHGQSVEAFVPVKKA